MSVFLSFNKIKKLNCTPDDIKKALSKSELIELSDNKEKIRRKTPLVVKNNVEECTIYVENIKGDANHEWLSHFFSDFGNVVYVSIPKYKLTKGNKGFAFIEFEKEVDAQNALIYFESIGCKIPSDTNPNELASIKTFVDVKKKQYENSECQKIGCSNADESKISCAEEKNLKKRKISLTDNKDEKRMKTDIEDESANKGELGYMQTHETENRKKKKHKKDKKKNYIRDLGLKILSK